MGRLFKNHFDIYDDFSQFQNFANACKKTLAVLAGVCLSPPRT